jgi:hypothetical protein
VESDRRKCYYFKKMEVKGMMIEKELNEVLETLKSDDVFADVTTADLLKAALKAFDYCGVYTPEMTESDLKRYFDDDETLIFSVGRNGRLYAWVMWSENIESCVDVETLEELSEEEVEKWLI